MNVSRDPQEFPALRAFLEAYFHEDWRVDDPTPEKVVERFCRDEPMPAVQKVREEISHDLG